MENQPKKSKICLSKPEDIPQEQTNYNYDVPDTSNYTQNSYNQEQYSNRPLYEQNRYQQPTQTYQQDAPRRLNPDIPKTYQNSNPPAINNSPFQNSNYARNIQGNPNAMKYCKFCGGNIPFDAVVCTICGRQVEQLNQGVNNYQQNNTYINNNININNNGNVSDKSRTTAGVLCALGFFGVGGIHRLYSGHIASGLLYLFTYGLFGVGTIIDLVRLLRGTFTDKNGRRLKD